MRTLLALALLLAGTVACRAGEAPPADAARDTASARATDTASRGIIMAHGDTAWAVGLDRAGVARAGMAIVALRDALGGALITSDDMAECKYATSPHAPAGMRFMLAGSTMVRIDVDSAGIPTRQGVAVGDREALVRERYGARVTETPHKYTSGHYLTVMPMAGADTAHRLVFETDGARVTRYRAGLRPYVEWVEGCG